MWKRRLTKWILRDDVILTIWAAGPDPDEAAITWLRGKNTPDVFLCVT